MRVSYLPSSVQSTLFSFDSCFTAPTFENFVSLVLGWILCTGSHTISRAFREAKLFGLTDKHHSTAYRFFSRARWDSDRVGQVLFTLLLPFLPKNIEVAVDDTLCHRSGPQVFGTGMHHDGSRSNYRGGKKTAATDYGHNWVLLTVWVPYPWNPARGLAVALVLRLYRSKKLCQPPSEFRKKTELAAEMIRTLISWLPEGQGYRLHVTGDSAYGSRTVIRDLPQHATFVGAMVMNAALYDVKLKPYKGRGRRPTTGKRLPTPRALSRRKNLAWQRTTVCMYGRDVELLLYSFVAVWHRVRPGKAMRIVITRDPNGRYEDRAYFCTDSEWQAATIPAKYSNRWPIEVTIGQAKQVLGLEEPRNGWWRRPHGSRRPYRQAGPESNGQRGRMAVEHTVPFAFLAYGIVFVWYLHHGKPAQDTARARKSRPWDRQKMNPSYADMVTALRREFWVWRISRYPSLRGVRRKLEGLVGLWLPAA